MPTRKELQHMKPTGIRVSDGAQLRELAAAVINQAVKDLVLASDGNKPKSLGKRLSAFFWLTSPELEIWLDFAGAEYLDPYKLLPRLGQIRKQFQKGKTHE
jgi:hypothetical protein